MLLARLFAILSAVLLPNTLALPDAETLSVANAAAAPAIVVSVARAQASQNATSTTHAATGSATASATAAWATQTTGGMTQTSNAEDTIVVHSDAGLTYGCPRKGDTWQIESLTDSLSAHVASGPGCFMRYSFTGDSIQVYGASGLQAGVFGCSIDAGPADVSGWWSAYGSADFFRPYSGSCSLQGIGYGKHTIQLTNSPYQPKKVYFTGLHYTTNKTQPIWQSLKWSACCQAYTFPDGVATTVAAVSATATSGANGVFYDFDSSTFTFIIFALAAVVIAAASLIGIMCCKPRKSGINPQALHDVLNNSEDSDEKRPLRKSRRHTARSKQHLPSDEESTGRTTEASTDTTPTRSRPLGKHR